MPVESTHFTVDEFRCQDGTEYPPEWYDRLDTLMAMLDVIREAWGGPLVVVSGYRSPAYNKALIAASKARNGGKSGVATDSQHIQGRAADIRPSKPTPAAVDQLHALVLELHGKGKLPAMGGLGKYVGWIHVDTRESPTLVSWNG